MVLSRMAWPEVDAASRESVVLIPTGSLEQHGPHLPLFTDTLIVTAVAEAVERNLADRVLLTPTLWLGASGHHLAFAGSLSNSFEAYIGAVESVAESLIPHGFYRFYVLNGHGGNTSPNDLAVRNLKARHPEMTFGQRGYHEFYSADDYAVLEGPQKTMRHADEAEVSLILHLHPELVRTDRLVDDGLAPDPPLQGVVHHFDEITEHGVLGYGTFAKPGTGKALFESAVGHVTAEIRAIADGYVLSRG
ncbi:MAG TPA: creatininase family protein [Fimbriimonas sp.]